MSRFIILIISMDYVNMTSCNNNYRVATVTPIVSRFALCCMDVFSIPSWLFRSSLSFITVYYLLSLCLSFLYPDRLWPPLGWNGKIVSAILVGPAGVWCRQRVKVSMAQLLPPSSLFLFLSPISFTFQLPLSMQHRRWVAWGAKCKRQPSRWRSS